MLLTVKVHADIFEETLMHPSTLLLKQILNLSPSFVSLLKFMKFLTNTNEHTSSLQTTSYRLLKVTTKILSLIA